jgi:hypothetical protein
MVVIGLRSGSGGSVASDGNTPAADTAAKSDLRNGLAAEETTYTDTQTYSSSITTLKTVDASLPWGTTLRVSVIADSFASGQDFCLSETSPSGTTYAVAKIALGPNANVYYGRNGCPSPLTESAIAAMPTDSTAGWGSQNAPAQNAPAPEKDAATKSDLRNGVAVEETIYTDVQTYSDAFTTLNETDSSLPWGTKLHVSISRDQQDFCLSETSPAGTTYAIAKVAVGPNANVYYGKNGCPSTITDASFAGMATDSTTGWGG